MTVLIAHSKEKASEEGSKKEMKKKRVMLPLKKQEYCLKISRESRSRIMHFCHLDDMVCDARNKMGIKKRFVLSEGKLRRMPKLLANTKRQGGHLRRIV